MCVSRFFPFSFTLSLCSPPSKPSCELRETRKERKHDDETAQRETNTEDGGGGGGGGCVLTVGMSATLWVIKKEIPLLPIPPLWEVDLEAAGESEPAPGLITQAQPVHQTPARGEGKLEQRASEQPLKLREDAWSRFVSV